MKKKKVQPHATAFTLNFACAMHTITPTIASHMHHRSMFQVKGAESLQLEDQTVAYE